MNILFVSDFSLNHNRGGAQRSNDLIINTGIDLGHNITPFNVDSDPKLLDQQYEIVISSEPLIKTVTPFQEGNVLPIV